MIDKPIPQVSFGLDKKKRIQKRKEFLFVQKKGRRSFGKFIVAIASHSAFKTDGRIGITVSKKIGPAHERNLLKRRIRHILRTHPRLFSKKYLVIIAKKAIVNAAFSELEADIVGACERVPKSPKIINNR